MLWPRLLWILSISSLSLASEARSEPSEDKDSSEVYPIYPTQIPPELKPWVPWVMSQHPDLACPLVSEERSCVWPGVLEVEAQATEGRWRLEVHVDKKSPVWLPGGRGTWPTKVLVDGRPLPVWEEDGHPMVTLNPGSHVISARLAYKERPSSLPVPPRVGRVQLKVDEQPVKRPVVDADGLRLGAVHVDDRLREHLEIEVWRKVHDGIPVLIETIAELRASGRGREVDLGPVLLKNTQAVSLKANLPARFTSEGTLLVQVRPGTYRLKFKAIHTGPADALHRQLKSSFWPDLETWVVATNEQVRAINIDGAVAVEPSRTTLPHQWRTLSAFSVSQNDALRFETLRRGDPDPAPNQLKLNRSLWLDLDGQGLTVQDRFSGQIHRDWRLDAVPPLELGHAAAHGEDVVITRGVSKELSGLELRREGVSVLAESRIEGRPTNLLAVGWKTDVVSLNSTLHLPPGFRLFAGMGVDRIDGSVIDAWSLFDLFFVLVLTMATFRLLGLPWGLIALVGLSLARHEAGAPQWVWAFLLVFEALRRVVRHERGLGWVRGLRFIALLVVAFQLIPFGVGQLQTGVFFVLEAPWLDGRASSYPGRSDYSVDDLIPSSSAPRQQKKMRKKDTFLPPAVDPQAVVQTGPGVPQWSWNKAQLKWSGPVSQHQSMRLIIWGPWTNRILAFLRVFLLLALALRLARPRTPKKVASATMTGAAAVGFWVLLGVHIPSAEAAPDPAVLEQLEKRLTAPPSCGSECVAVPQILLSIENDVLALKAKVHAEVDGAWPIPGPTRVWVPRVVLVDGQVSTSLLRFEDGFLRVRLSAGVHDVEVRGPLPPVDTLPLAFGPIVPKYLEWSAKDWTLDGLRANGTVDASIQLTRVIGRNSSVSSSTENLAPWLEVHRTLDLGLPWRVRTIVRRVGPTDEPLSLKIPLLKGEAMTEGQLETFDNLVTVQFNRDEREVAWLSTLPMTTDVVLTATTHVPWTEKWSLNCGAIFACTYTGPAPLSHVDAGLWGPIWRAWPGEEVRIRIRRPEGVEGQTTTIDDVSLTYTPGRRHLLAKLALKIRSSQGGRQIVVLPEGAELQSVKLRGMKRPIQLRQGRALHVPLTPGAQGVVIEWRQARAAHIYHTMPEVDLGGPAVNVRVVVKPSRDRWIAALFGPQWGPVPLMWVYLIGVIVMAPLLGRVSGSPLSSFQWLLLGLGMTQVHIVGLMIVVAWFFAIVWRKNQSASLTPRVFNFAQFGLFVLTLVALTCLYIAIHRGLLWQPDVYVTGGGSSATRLQWFVDRIDRMAPRPSVVSFPLWTWRVVMLLWSLWIAARLVKWLPWAFRAWSQGGWRKNKEEAAENAEVAEEPTAT